ncbi:surface lipoprotein assembly modifier [Aliiruegeria sabulilitoris]|uniref:surface lipoprotein assembly modifier n=1 Tax=Aliiruegeria sabulilitoris TaxID=1510458 RepID=UPI0012E38188|nr:surface lipoprotein assembly modifier [Aliiruegeria sabulilitoris]NDR56527.1 DUF560 domain-containing protein [Pseudoruegeria sp. M32A2M]
MLGLALGVSLSLGSAITALAESFTLDPDAMRATAALSIEQNNPQQALQLAEALLQRDPEDVEALVLKSRALRDLGKYREALDAARAAHQLAESDVEIYSTSLARAQALSSLGARTRAQLWLRMAGQHAPNEEARARAIQDFRYVRARNRWNTNLSFSIAPTSNVNGGSVHDTISYGGLQGIVLGGTARALSGLSYSGGLTTRYRFSESRNHQTELGLHLYHQSYLLSDESQEQAPDAEGDDFAYSSVAVGLRHKWRPEGWNTPLEFSLLAGRGWYGLEDYSRYTRTAIARAFLLGKSTALRLEAGGEQFHRVTDDAEQRSLHASATLLHEFDNGGGMRLNFGIRDSDSDTGSLDYRRVMGGVGYTLPKPIGSARVTLEADIEHRLYENFPTVDTTDIFIIMTEKEREDLRTSVGVQLFFDKVEYYGFSPTVTLRHSETRSTDDRYDTVETGLNFGFRSNF